MSESIGTVLLSLSQVQTWLNLDGTENTDILAQAVTAANQAVIDYLGWDPTSQTVTERVDGTGTTTLVVTGRPITAVSAISLLCPGIQPQVLDLTNVDWDPVQPFIYLGQYFPSGDNNVQVTYTRGYTTLPPTILQAVRYTIKSMLDGSTVDFNATGESFAGVSSQQWQPGGPAVVPASAKTLLLHWRRKF